MLLSLFISIQGEIDMENLDNDFYGDIEKGNAVVHQQARNNIMLAITSQITNLVMTGEDPERATALMNMLKDMKDDNG